MKSNVQAWSKDMYGDRGEATAPALWQALHGHSRFRPRYPSEEVVRFLASSGYTNILSRGLDYGCGAGRHLNVLHEFGYQPYGYDVSQVALDYAAKTCPIATLLAGGVHKYQCYFNVAIAHGSLYYASKKHLVANIATIKLCLKRGAKFFCTLKPTCDKRLYLPDNEQLGEGCVRLVSNATNEAGMVMCFLTRDEVAGVFCKWNDVQVQLRTVGSGRDTPFAADDPDNRSMECDWLVTARS